MNNSVGSTVLKAQAMLGAYINGNVRIHTYIYVCK